MSKLFKKPRGFGTAKYFKSIRRRKDVELFIPFADTVVDPVDTQLTELTRRVGDEKTAKRVQKLAIQYPNGTIPELVTMDWLQRGGWRFIYQAELYGGRSTSGGLLPDFVVDTGGGTGAAWQIQGEYWHGRSKEKEVSDAAAALRLIGQTVAGVRIDKVLNLWENDILNRRPQVFQYAIAGMALR